MFTFNGVCINTLEDVPEDCQILLVSEKEDEPPKGLLNNLYDFKTQQDYLRHSMQNVEESMANKKAQWATNNH